MASADATAPRPAPPAYPARLDIEYPEGGLSRLTTAFRVLLVIPIGILAALLSGTAAGWVVEDDSGASGWLSLLAVAGGTWLPLVLMLLFRRKYPRWWFDWNLELTRLATRIGAYSVLLRDEYPSTDEAQAVRLDLDYPDAGRDLSRWLPLIKWLLAVPHYIVLTVLALLSLVLVIVAWFAILFTGRYPRGIFDFVVGVTRWGLRVQAYAFLLVTDRYPPFRLRA